MSRFRGSIAQMVEAGLMLNGVELSQPVLSVLTRVGNGVFSEPVGKIMPEGQGKPAIVWELHSTDDLQFGVPRQARSSRRAEMVEEEAAPKRRRGRPRKVEEEAVEEVAVAPRKRGRPRKVEEEAVEENTNRKPRVIDLGRRLEARAA